MNKLLAQIDLSKLEIPANEGLIDVNSTSTTIGDIISAIFTTYIFYVAGIALLVYMIIAGLQLMLAKGDPKAMQAAQARITNAAIGFVIIFLSYFIVQIVGRLLGINDTLFGQIFS